MYYLNNFDKKVNNNNSILWELFDHYDNTGRPQRAV